MTEMVRAELSLESIRGLAERGGHDTGIGDDEIEGLAGGIERVGAGADALERGEVELDELEPAAIDGGGAHLLGGPLGLVEIANRADDMGAVGGERAGSLDADAGRDAGHQD